jgi:hypothetical protein
MLKIIGLIFDAALCKPSRLRTEDEVNVAVHVRGAIVITPMHPILSKDDATAAAKH